MKLLSSTRTIRRHTSRTFRLVLLPTICAWTSLSVNAATRTWDGSYSGYWSASQNWVEGVAPTDGDDLVFPSGAANLVNTNNTGYKTFRSITISGSGYTLRGLSSGVSIVLTNGLEATFGTGSSTVELNLDLGSSQSFECLYSAAYIYVSGNINLGSHTLTTLGAGHVLLGGLISGTGGLTKSGSGTHWLYGSSANTYSGDTLVNSGTLMLAKTSGNAILYGQLTIGDGVGTAGSTLVREQGDFQIGAIPITINSDGWLDVDDYDDTVGAIFFDGGMASSVTGTLFLGGNVTVSGNDGTISGQLGLGSATRVFAVDSGGRLYVDANISGTGGIIKTNMGMLTFASANSYSGVTTLEGGMLEVLDDGGLGATTSGTVLHYGFLRLAGASVVGESLEASGGVLQAILTSSAWTGPITLSGDIIIEVPNAGQALELAGAITGTGGFTKTGPGSLTLSGSSPNTYTGDTVVEGGRLELSKPDGVEAISAGSLTIGDGIGGAGADVVRETHTHQIGNLPVRINDSGLLDLNGNLDYLAAVTFDGGRVTTGTGMWALSGDVTVLANTNRAARIDGRVWLPGVRGFDVANSIFYPDLAVYASVEGSGGIQKSGIGTLLLYSSNSYSGLTLVGEGLLGAYNSHAFGATTSGTVVSNGAALVVNNNSHVPAEPLTLSGWGFGSYGALDSFIGTNSWAGDVTLDSDARIRVLGIEDSLELSGQVTGTGNLAKTGEGTLVYSGSTANNYNGDTYVNGGTLEMNKTAANAVPHALYIGTSSGTEHSVVARNQNSAQCDNVVVNATGLYDLNGFNETLGSLTLNGGGDVQTGTGLLTLNPTSVLVVDPGTVTNASAEISGYLNVGTGQRVLQVGQGVYVASDYSDLVIDAVISGSAEIIKEGAGQLQLDAANTFTGPVTVNSNALRLAHPQGLGSTAAGTTVNGSAYLQLHGGGIDVGAEPLTLNSTRESWGSLYSTSGSNSWAGDITLQTDAWIGLGISTAVLELSGAIQGPGSLNMERTGTIILSGSSSNSYGGATYVGAGTLILNKTAANGAIPGTLVIGDGAGGLEADVVRVAGQNQIANNAPVTVNSSGLLEMASGLADLIGSLSGNGRVDLGTDALYTGYDNTSTTFSGVIRGAPGCELDKLGTGTFTLTGDNTYPGWTYVTTGTLTVQGNQPASPVSVGGSATLSGTGTVGNVLSAGNVMPGTSPGILTCSNVNLTGADYYVELNGLAPGTGYDQLNVRGTNQLGSPFLHVNLGYMPAVGDTFVIINNDGTDAVAGTFASLPDGASLTASNATLRINYSGGTGNDVVLTVTNVVSVEPLRFTSVVKTDTNVVLTWSGGTPFYVVEKKSALTDGTWQPITSPMRDTQTNAPTDTPAGFYRVSGGN
jgi:autotransporter-associated beta strand protein